MFYQDDVKEVLAKLKWADGMIFIVPNYALGVPGILKNLFDRLAYLFHRPRLFRKFFIPIVVQGVYGGRQIVKYINEVMGFWGMETFEGVVVRGGLELSDAKLSDNDILKIKRAINKFVSIVKIGKLKAPSFFRLLIFRSTRTSMEYSNEVLEVDKKFFVQSGWTKSDYFYEIKLTFLKRIVGRLADVATRRMILKDKQIKREINT
jgi:NAD(P)H-dependent FMN reductase